MYLLLSNIFSKYYNQRFVNHHGLDRYTMQLIDLFINTCIYNVFIIIKNII